MRLLAALLLTYLAHSTAFAFENLERFRSDEKATKILVFLSKDCPCSRSHVEHLNELSQQFSDVAFYGVISDEFTKESTPLIESYFASSNFKFTIIKDPEQKLVKEFGALKTPHVTILKKQPNGKYTRIYEGGVSDHRDFSHAKATFLKENLMAVANNKPLPHSNGKSLGCYIRRL